MLTAFRAFARSWVAAVMMGLLIVSFVGWGASKYGFSAVKGDEVIRAGSRVTTSLDFRRAYENAKKRYEQQTGQPLTPEVAAANNVDKLVLSQMATEEAFNEALSRAGIRSSDTLIAAEIRKIPGFFDPVTGRFDKKTYEQRLGENGLKPAIFERSLSDQMAAQHYLVGVGNGLVAPRAYGALAAVFALETRDLSFFQITPASVGAPPAPTDAQLMSVINEHKAQLTRPEARLLTVVRFVPQVTQSGPVDQAELQKRYNFRKDTFAKPETRTIVQVPAKTQAVAQQVLGRIQKGEAPAAIAKSLGVEAISYEEKPKTAIPDHKLAETVFGLQAGQVSIVQGDLGLAVVKIVSVSPGRTVTLDEARPMLEAEVRKDAANEAVYKSTQTYDDAHQAGSDMAAAAQKAGAATSTVGPITQQGADLKGQPISGVTPRILEAAFGLPAGGESELTEGDNGEYFAVKVDRIIPASVPPLEEIRAELTKFWQQQEVGKRMEARAKELFARVQKGEAMDAVAASGGYAVTRLTGLSRQTAQSVQNVPREVLGRAFGAKAGEAFMSPTQGFTYAIGKAENVHIDPGPTGGQLAEGQRGSLTQDLVKEVMASAQSYAREKLKVRVDPARARAAIGLEPEAPAKAAKSK